MSTVLPDFNTGDVITESDLQTVCDAINGLEDFSSLYVETTGSSTPYIAALDPAMSAYQAGVFAVVKASFTNAGGGTQINFNSLGDKDIVHNDSSGTDLVAGEMVSGCLYLLVYRIYSGTGKFAILNPTPIVVSYADDETPTGTIDGVNDDFTLAHTPSPVASLQIFVNGVYQVRTVDYTITGDAITFTTPPASLATIKAFYRY